MKIFSLLIFFLIFFVSCYSTRKKWEDNNGRSFVGTWDKLTIMSDKDTVLYSNKDATNARIKVDSTTMQLYINYGQEDAIYVIDEVRFIDNEFFMLIHHVNDESKHISTLKCKLLDDDKSYWDYYGDGSYKINNVFNLFTNQPQRYRTLEE